MAEASDDNRLQPADSEVADASGESIAQSASLFLMARRALLASLGAVAITIEESNDFLSRLVDRGEVAESEIAKLVNDYVNRSQPSEKPAVVNRRSTVDRATVALADSVEVILDRLNVPTRADIEELSRKIGVLNEKVLTLRQKGGHLAAGNAARGAPALEVEGAPGAHNNGDG